MVCVVRVCVVRVCVVIKGILIGCIAKDKEGD